MVKITETPCKVMYQRDMFLAMLPHHTSMLSNVFEVSGEYPNSPISIVTSIIESLNQTVIHPVYFDYKISNNLDEIDKINEKIAYFERSVFMANARSTINQSSAINNIPPKYMVPDKKYFLSGKLYFVNRDDMIKFKLVYKNPLT